MPQLTWNRTYSWSSRDNPRSGLETEDGGLAILSYSEPEGSAELDFRLVKLDSNGNLLWTHTYGGEDYDYGMSVVQTTGGGFALTGYTYSYGAGSADAWLIKTNADGKVEWERTYGEPNEDIANTLIQTVDDGYLLAGTSRSYGRGDVDAWLLKTDNKGVMQWSQTYGGPRWDEAESLIQTDDGGYVFTGVRSIGDSASPEELWVAKTDATGKMEWNRTYGGIWTDQAYSVISSREGGYTIAGRNVPDETGERGPDFWLVKTDVHGVVEWNCTYGGLGLETARSVVQTADGGYALLGETDSFGAGSYDFWLVKTDANGTAQWNQTYGGPHKECPNSLVKTSDGGLVLIGYIKPLDIFNYSYLIIKIGGEMISDTLTPTQPSQLNFIHTLLIPLGISIIILLGVFVIIVTRKRKSY